MNQMRKGKNVEASYVSFSHVRLFIDVCVSDTVCVCVCPLLLLCMKQLFKSHVKRSVYFLYCARRKPIASLFVCLYIHTHLCVCVCVSVHVCVCTSLFWYS